MTLLIHFVSIVLQKFDMKNLLIIGGAGRNVGKTEFICRIIEKISKEQEIYALKVSAIFPDEQRFHGNHDSNEEEHVLFEETNRSSGKDTSRMLQAGASKVFYLRAEDTKVREGFEQFISLVPEGSPIICESNSLEKVVQPAYHIMVRAVDGQVKPRAISQLDSADLVVISDGISGFSELETIRFNEDKHWKLRCENREPI